MRTIKERYGQMMKLEALVSLTSKMKDNTMVLEAPEPFPGFFSYYSEVPTSSTPYYIYLVTNQSYTLEEITRATQYIQDNFSESFEAARGCIKIGNENYPVIRIRKISDYNYIEKIQSAYEDNGIIFRKKPSKQIVAEGTISLDKFFLFEEVEDGIFLDATNPDHGYFSVPDDYDWDAFEKLTRLVKYNWEGTNFDASFGFYYRRFRIHNIVRIYNPKLDVDYLKKVKSAYFSKMKNKIPLKNL